jgi:hypothetical protein
VFGKTNKQGKKGGSCLEGVSRFLFERNLPCLLEYFSSDLLQAGSDFNHFFIYLSLKFVAGSLYL